MFKKPERNVTKKKPKVLKCTLVYLRYMYAPLYTIYAACALTFNAAFCQNASGLAINKNALAITIKIVFSISIVFLLGSGRNRAGGGGGGTLIRHSIFGCRFRLHFQRFLCAFNYCFDTVP